MVTLEDGLATMKKVHELLEPVEVKVEGKKLVKVMWGIPNEGHTLTDAYDNRLIMATHLGTLQVLSHFGAKEYGGMLFDYPDNVEFEFYQATVGNVLTPIARDRIAELAYEEGMDYLFFIDDDMLSQPDLFERLYKHQKDIVGALAFTRFGPHKPVIYVLDEGFDPIEKKAYYTSKAYLNYPKDTLVECDAVGFGAVLIDCKVLKKVRRPWFTPATGKGEDIQFCFEARKAGFKVYMDTATKLGHLGPPKVITEEVYDQETNAPELREIYGSGMKYQGKDVK